MDFTTTALLASIRRRAATASVSTDGSADSDLLQLANEELHASLLPLILKAQGEHLIPQFDYEVSTSAGVDKYRIPSRAAFNRIREVVVVDASGSAIRNLYQGSVEDQELWANEQGRPEAFYVRGSQLVLRPIPAEAETLRVTYCHRPNELTATTANWATVATVAGTAVTTTGNHGFTPATIVDFVKADSPFEPLSIDVTMAAASGSSITLSSAISGLAVGDYVCVREKSPVPMLPAELHPALVDLTVSVLLRNKGYLQESAAWTKSAGAKLSEALEMLTPRVDGEAKVASPDAFSILGGYDGGRWGF